MSIEGDSDTTSFSMLLASDRSRHQSVHSYAYASVMLSQEQVQHTDSDLTSKHAVSIVDRWDERSIQCIFRVFPAEPTRELHIL